MFKILLALHLLFAIFAIGPLVHAATTAGRGVRRGDGAATASSARLLRIYSYGSAVVVLVGFGLMSAKSPTNPKQHVGEFGDTWIWLSLLLWVVAIGLVLGVVVPTLDKASALIQKEESVVSLTARVAAGGGIVAVLFAVIVFVMVYRPGH
ncbi:MAG: hypothetical protein JWR06_2472 [Jatrophihabitans sp.]|jgi:hypothetical protein|nr:hypothetical protein [Jatrophihabitans sp.]MCW2658279.1 hypothetical protein [Jatrophihabitans sp.]MDT4906453.1 hypothetical protein [Pseudonocardiales bacterium]MDT4928681.1 hypothetical protein [Pseudonocardiales bacterium]MDT4951124.1 hypothetical protein [Pseudonocardiales bacterium]